MYSDGSRVVQQVGGRTAGGAFAHYRIVDGDKVLVDIPFQHDTIPKVGVVGATNETMLAIVIDRLNSFQQGGYPCQENEIALDACKAALAALEYRTQLRIQRQVEGQHKA